MVEFNSKTWFPRSLKTCQCPEIVHQRHYEGFLSGEGSKLQGGLFLSPDSVRCNSPGAACDTESARLLEKFNSNRRSKRAGNYSIKEID